MNTQLRMTQLRNYIVLIAITVLILGCGKSSQEQSEASSVRTEDRMARFLGKWQNKDRAILLDITENGFHYVSSSESIDVTGEIQLQENRLIVGRPEEDGGYAVISDRGTLLIKQENSPRWELELMKVE